MHIASIRFYYIPLKTKYFHLTLNITISTWKATHMLSLSVGSSGSNICIWYTPVRFIEHWCICCYVVFLLSIYFQMLDFSLVIDIDRKIQYRSICAILLSETTICHVYFKTFDFIYKTEVCLFLNQLADVFVIGMAY